MKKLLNTKCIILSVVSFVLSSNCFASNNVDLGNATSSTPYDRYMSPVKQVLGHLNGESPSMDKVRQFMSQGRNFRYSFTDPYTAATPQVTASIHAGDCKAKSLWLANQINDPSVRYVIGRARSSSRISHAWLMWKHDDRWFILDCTNTRDPIPVDRINPAKEYIPLYSYAKTGTYSHLSTQMMMASSMASHRQALVASNSQNN